MHDRSRVTQQWEFRERVLNEVQCLGVSISKWVWYMWEAENAL